MVQLVEVRHDTDCTKAKDFPYGTKVVAAEDLYGGVPAEYFLLSAVSVREKLKHYAIKKQ
jgi:hypothetical protein